MKTEFIIEYCERNYPKEVELIARSMINYYHIKNKELKTEIDIKLKHKIYTGVIKLFKELSRLLSIELDYNENEIYDILFAIHIKT